MGVEADHDFVSDDDGWGGAAVQFYELAEGSGVCGHVLVFERDVARGEELFGRVAGRASGLAVEDDFLHSSFMVARPRVFAISARGAGED